MHYRIDEKCNVVCFSINIVLSHLKEIITVYSNDNDIVLSLIIFVMPSSVNLIQTLYEPVTKKYIPQVGARIVIINEPTDYTVYVPTTVQCTM